VQADGHHTAMGRRTSGQLNRRVHLQRSCHSTNEEAGKAETPCSSPVASAHANDMNEAGRQEAGYSGAGRRLALA